LTCKNQKLRCTIADQFFFVFFVRVGVSHPTLPLRPNCVSIYSHHFLCLLAQSLLLFECGLSSLRILLTVMSPATMIKIMIRFTVTQLFIDHFPKDSMIPVICYSIYRNKLALSKRFF
jgi:hypothetical protein